MTMEWRLEGREYRQLLSEATEKWLESPHQVMIKNTACCLFIYPDGYNHRQRGNVNIFLVAKQNQIHLRVQYRILCPEHNTEWSGTCRFEPNKSSHLLANKLTRNQLDHANHITFQCQMAEQVDSSSSYHIHTPSKHASFSTHRQRDVYGAHSNSNAINNRYRHSKQQIIPHPSMPVQSAIPHYNLPHSVCWDLDRLQIEQLMRTKPGCFIKSPDFALHGYSWRIKCYPHGPKQYLDEWCVFYLQLMHIPQRIYTLQAAITVHIAQLHCNYYKSRIFGKEYHYHDTGDTDSCLLLKSGYVPRQALLGLDRATILIGIDLRKIQFVIEHPNTLGKIRTCHHLKFSHRLSFEWNVPHSLLLQFKQCRNGQIWASEKSEAWYLSVAPNGVSPRNDGKVILSLNLIELPESISAITANIVLTCNEQYVWKSTLAFKRRPNRCESMFSAWPEDILNVWQLRGLQHVCFSCDIKVIAMYDRDGVEIANEEYKVLMSLQKDTKVDKKRRSSDEEKKEMKEDELLNEYETPGYLPDEAQDEGEKKSESKQNAEWRERVQALEQTVSALTMRLREMESKMQAANTGQPMINNNNYNTVNTEDTAIM